MSQASPSSSSLSAEAFATFFEEKINTILQSFPPTSINTIHSPSPLAILLKCFSPLFRGSAASLIHHLSAGSYPCARDLGH